MRVTTFNPLYAEPNRYAFDQPKYLTYEGERVPAPKWCPEGTIALATGNPAWPVRVIDAGLIISVDDATVTETKSDPNVRTVTVAGSKGESYVVTITPTGKTCTCQGFGFRHTCKHVMAAN